MLYLEDYLEMIEHLPQELRDRFTLMREMDLTVQNSMDTLDKRTRLFFGQCKRNELPNSDIEFQNLRKDYYKVLEDGDEKVSLATQMHELVERYLRRLDSELFKFKLELEADNNGITEILEKRSLELDGNNSISSILNQKENRYFGSIGSNNLSGSQKDNRYRHKSEKKRDSLSAFMVSSPVVEHKRPNLGNNMVPNSPILPINPTVNIRPTHHQVIGTPQTISSPTLATSSTTSPASVSLGFQHLGAGGAIAAAATQAIVATQQMQQGRRTASLKASYEAIHGSSSSGSHDLLGIGRELAGAAHNAIQAVEREGNILHTQKKQHKKKLSTSINSIPGPSSMSSSPLPSLQLQGPGIDSQGMPRMNDNGLIVEQTADGEWTYDPNEPRYCICNQVSYGDMVACDNEACPFEWFHYPCVGITQSPKGKWYCPKCTASMRRRGNRKN